jgi:regulator of nonsense transcripts 2
MKTQQAAEREEQQRIKNLVLNYDLRDGEEQDGISPWAPIPNLNIYTKNIGLEKTAALNPVRLDKSGNNRSGQRARKLQLSDVDWYAPKPNFSHVEHKKSSPTVQTMVVDTSPSHGTRSPRMTPHTRGQGTHIPTSGARSGGRFTRKVILGERASGNAARRAAGMKYIPKHLRKAADV